MDDLFKFCEHQIDKRTPYIDYIFLSVENYSINIFFTVVK